MRTLVTTSPDVAASFVRRGGLAAFPTETVYGLGADALDAEAIEKIFVAKGRPSDNPLIVHVSDVSEIDALTAGVHPYVDDLVSAFFPGPLTVVLPRHERIPEVVSAGLPTVGIRMPDHPVAQAFLRACGRPVAAPSANVSGRPSPTTWQAVRADLGGRIDCILKGAPTAIGLESTVVDCTAASPLVLRAGAVTLEQLRTVVADTRLAATADEAMVRSPGTRHRHYAPHAQVVLVWHATEATPAPEATYVGLEPPQAAERFALCEVHTDVEAYSRALYHFFRRSDAIHARTIYCQQVPPSGLGRALMDRLTRAARR